MSGRREEIAAALNQFPSLDGIPSGTFDDISDALTVAVDRLCAEAAAEALEAAAEVWDTHGADSRYATNRIAKDTAARALRDRAAGLRGAVKGSESAQDGSGGADGIRTGSDDSGTVEGAE